MRPKNNMCRLNVMPDLLSKRPYINVNYLNVSIVGYLPYQKSLKIPIGLNRSRKFKDTQYNDQMNKEKRENELQNTTQKTKHRTTQTPFKTGSKLRCSGKVTIFKIVICVDQVLKMLYFIFRFQFSTCNDLLLTRVAFNTNKLWGYFLKPNKFSFGYRYVCKLSTKTNPFRYLTFYNYQRLQCACYSVFVIVSTSKVNN